MFRELLARIINFKDGGVIYKPFLEYIKSHYGFKSMFESFRLNPYCLFDYVSTVC